MSKYQKYKMSKRRNIETSKMSKTQFYSYFTVDQWELTSSQSRTTASESCVVRFHDFENAQRPDRLLEMVIERLFARVLAGRPPPIRVGFQLQCPNFEKPFYIPMRPPQQNTARVIADALQQVCDQSGDGLDLFTGAAQTKVLCCFPPSNAGMIFVYFSMGNDGNLSLQEWGHVPLANRHTIVRPRAVHLSGS
jgi:hypothetical protein